MENPTKSPGPLRDPEGKGRITRAEVMDVLADEGYSADKRKGWLKEVLTRLTGDGADPADPDHVTLVQEIRTILGEQLDQPSVAQQGQKPEP